MADVVIFNAQTGEVTERDFTAEELAQREADAAAYAIVHAAETAAQSNRATLTGRAQTALQANRDFLAITSPTNTQAVAQVQALTRQNTAIIRLLLGLVDGID